MIKTMSLSLGLLKVCFKCKFESSERKNSSHVLELSNSFVFSLVWDLRGVYLKTQGKLYQSLDLKSSFGGDSVATQRSFKVQNLWVESQSHK